MLYRKLGTTPLHELFHLNSELNDYNHSTMLTAISEALSSETFRKNSISNEKYDANKPLFSLPTEFSNYEDYGLFEVLKMRRSTRNFSNVPLLLEDLSFLLLKACAPTSSYKPYEDSDICMLFSYPIAGSIPSLDIYIAVHQVTDIPRGFYYYNPYKHQLSLLKPFEDDEIYLSLTFSQDIMRDSAISFYLVGDMTYKGMKYMDRGYRFITLEAGHLAQNICLVSTALSIGSVMSGGFNDNAIKKIIGDDHAFVLYELILGSIEL